MNKCACPSKGAIHHHSCLGLGASGKAQYVNGDETKMLKFEYMKQKNKMREETVPSVKVETRVCVLTALVKSNSPNACA